MVSSRIAAGRVGQLSARSCDDLVYVSLPGSTFPLENDQNPVVLAVGVTQKNGGRFFLWVFDGFFRHDLRLPQLDVLLNLSWEFWRIASGKYRHGTNTVYDYVFLWTCLWMRSQI